MKPTLLILGSLLFLLNGYSQTISDATKKLGPNPLFFVDSQEVEFNVFRNYDPFAVAHVNIIVSKKRLKKLGDRGKDGAIYVTTVNKAKMTYWSYFSLKSPDYKNFVPDPMGDTTIQYILNGDLLSKGYVGQLYQIANRNFRRIRLLGKEELQSKYHVTDKNVGVVIKAKKIKNVTADKPQ